MDRSITREDIAKAKAVDLCDVATSLGYTVKRIGNYHTLKEMDSVRIYNRSSWYRWSDGSGGSQIDFLLNFTGMDFTDAVKYLNNQSLDVLPPQTEVVSKRREFLLPTPSSDNMRVKKYLMKNRGLSEKTVEHFIKNGLIYQSENYSNVVFIGKDKDGKPRTAMVRGIGSDYKGDASGSDKSYGFRVEADASDTVKVFEAAIDLMSFYDATSLKSDHLIALGSTWDKPLMRFLEDHTEVKKIILCLDNDEPGKEAASKIKEKLEKTGYDVNNLGSPHGYKDYNEWLMAKKGIVKMKHPSEKMAMAR